MWERITEAAEKYNRPGQFTAFIGFEWTAGPGGVNLHRNVIFRDPDGANLDRIQIIKGWLDGKGKLHERVYDVAVSDGRKIDQDGRCQAPVGNTVNVDKATFRNTIGKPLYLAYWKDPDFNPKQRAFYYVRVLEIPTPTWIAHDVAFFGVPVPKDAVLVHQERAYTSPIWYSP